MEPGQFSENQRACCQRQAAGYWAFVPPPLPPELPIDWELVTLLSEADRAVAELSGAGRLLPNPHLLIRPYLRREAVLASGKEPGGALAEIHLRRTRRAR